MNQPRTYTNGCGILLMVLNHLGTIHTKIKLQKLLFLVHKEAQIKNGYNFKKHYFGPYSQDLAAEVEVLDQSGILNVEHTISSNKREYVIYSATEKSRELFSEEFTPSEDPKLIEKVQEITDKYKDCGYYELKEYVYKKYLPDELEYDERLKKISENLHLISYSWENLYREKDENLFIDIMAIVEYVNLVLKSIKENEYDEVIRGVILVISEDLIENTFEIRDYLSASLDYNKSAKDLESLFDFLSYYANKKGVFPSLENLDFSEILTPVEIEQLQDSNMEGMERPTQLEELRY